MALRPGLTAGLPLSRKPVWGPRRTEAIKYMSHAYLFVKAFGRLGGTTHGLLLWKEVMIRIADMNSPATAPALPDSFN